MEEQKTAAAAQAVYPRITVEIWSDVLCPFCYIGKRQFEAALSQYPGRDSVEVIWRSFQLDPTLQTDPSKNPVRSLSERKGWSEEYTLQIMGYVTQMAREVGLEYRLHRSVVANSFDAHRLIQLGRRRGCAAAVKERLFAAYFTEGQNIADPTVLRDIGVAAGLKADEIAAMLQSEAYAQAVRDDIRMAQDLQITGVPCFVFQRRQIISGAQGTPVFLRMLQEIDKGN